MNKYYVIPRSKIWPTKSKTEELLNLIEIKKVEFATFKRDFASCSTAIYKEIEKEYIDDLKSLNNQLRLLRSLYYD